MTKTLEHHQQEVLQKENRVNELRRSVEENERRLPELRQEYQTAVVEDGDNIDALFHNIQSLEQKIKADRYKLKTLEDVTAEFIKADAVEVIKGYKEIVKAVHQKKADKALQAVQDAKKEYIKALDVVDGIDEAFKAETHQYFNLIRERGLTKEDVNTANDQLFHFIEHPPAIVPAKGSLVVNGHDIKKGGK